MVGKICGNPDISLDCPKCGALLLIPQGVITLECCNCRSNLKMFQNDSICALQLASNDIYEISRNADIIVSEQEIERIKKELSSLREKESSLLYMVCNVNISSSTLYFDDQNLDYRIPKKFKSSVENELGTLYKNRTNNVPKNFYKKFYLNEFSAIDLEKIVSDTFIEEDYSSLIKMIKEKFDLNDKNSKESIAIEKFISRIEELIVVKKELYVKSSLLEQEYRNL